MGVIADRIKDGVLKRFEAQKDSTDLVQGLHADGYGFTIRRFDGSILTYDGTEDTYTNLTKVENICRILLERKEMVVHDSLIYEVKVKLDAMPISPNYTMTNYNSVHALFRIM